MMLPKNLWCFCCFVSQIQLQSALLQSMNASSGVVQSLASQNNLPATLISSALINANVAANLNGNSSSTTSMFISCTTSMSLLLADTYF